MKLRTYSELIKLSTFEDRYNYLKLNGVVGQSTFGSLRWLNQKFYTSEDWLRVRDKCIVRDLGCDLGIPGREIFDRITIHHMNPAIVEDLESRPDILLNLEFLICVSDSTHKAIHYGDKNLISKTYFDREPDDTTLWKKGRNWKAYFNQ